MSIRLTRPEIEERLLELFSPDQSAVLAEVLYKIRVAVIDRAANKKMSIRLTREEMEEEFLRVFPPDQAAVLAEVLDAIWAAVINRAVKQ